MAYGSVFGTKDMDRCGLFAEMSYMNGKGYTPPVRGVVSIRDLKRAQMNPGTPKVKTGLQDCYFDTKFKRVFEKEGWTTTFERDLRERMAAKEKNITKLPFVPTNYTKKLSCPGAFDGTFFIDGKVKAFSPLTREVVKTKEKIPPNVLVQPAKKGGPGYTDICLNRYPKEMGGIYDDPIVGAKDPKRHKERILGFLGGGVPTYFDSNPWRTEGNIPTYKRIFDSREKKFGSFMPTSYARKKGDRYYGGLSEFPEYIPPGTKDVKQSEKKEKKTAFYPQTRGRTFYTKSIVNRKIDISVNNDNWRTMKPVTFTREII